MKTQIEFDLSDLPEVVHASVQARLNKVVADCQKYADCDANHRPHLICAVLPAVKQELSLAMTEAIVLDETLPWLNANGRHVTIHTTWCQSSTKYIPAWDGPSRRLADAIVDHYRPETL